MRLHQPRNIPAYERVKKYAEYWAFIEWTATPSPLRKPQTQRDFARDHSIHETQLSRWRAMPEFNRDVVDKVSELMRDDLSDVMYALRNKIFKEGNAAEVKLFLEWATKWMPTIKLEHAGSVEGIVSDEVISRLAGKFENELREVLGKQKE